MVPAKIRDKIWLAWRRGDLGPHSYWSLRAKLAVAKKEGLDREPLFDVYRKAISGYEEEFGVQSV